MVGDSRPSNKLGNCRDIEGEATGDGCGGGCGTVRTAQVGLNLRRARWSRLFWVMEGARTTSTMHTYLLYEVHTLQSGQ